MSFSKSLALLVCDTPIPSVLNEHGDYRRIFTTLLESSLPAPVLSQSQSQSQDSQPTASESESASESGAKSTSGYTFTLDAYDVVVKQEYPSEEQLKTHAYDGILITGSAASAYEDKEWIVKLVAYTAHVIREYPSIKVIGICFGHQIIARALGGECVPNSGQWEVGPTELQLTDIGRTIFGVDSLNIQEMHRDHVPTLLPNFHLLGSTPVAYNQGMVKFKTLEKPAADTDADVVDLLNDIHVFTVQGHPEFTEPIVSKVTEFRVAGGIIPKPTAESAEKRRYDRNDGILVGRVIWKVLGVV